MPLATLSTSACPSVSTPFYDAPLVGSGWAAQLVVTGLHKPRSILFDHTDGLLVVESGTGIRHITFDDHGGTCLVVKNSTAIISATDLNHGIELSHNGDILYASSVNDVYSWPYDSSTGSVNASAQQTLVTGMQGEDHVTRTLLMSRDLPGNLLVSHGSNSNYDLETTDVSTGRSQIRAFDVTSSGAQANFANNEPYIYSQSGTVIGWGLRNSVGLAEEPTTNALYSVENSLDDMDRNGVDIHMDNPGEELNFHGRISSSGSSSRVGANFGYPECFALWDTNAFPSIGNLTVGSQFVTESSSAAVNDQTCATNYTAPRLTFAAHIAPLDIVFRADGTEAYISFHGSRDRTSPMGYKVSAVAFAKGEPVHAANSTTALQDILSNEDLSVCPKKCFRPAGLALDSKGRLFASSDSTGEIYVLQKTGVSTV
ncbi:glucose sorbosone dehydrogenase [Ophiostoma piceae UAMH 11346]|uniref:Glucose sorbosone dehydrogenase n=1 Tax=Ophiostoma piceae (strain UAMH 11346) TaxID=1262450 RepID=S3CST3_OPHP1|nr:glucose sorbosone dehydrogenase [Ophiostoma piceae UAMH 11346]